MKGQPMTTSALAGMGPAPLKSATIFSAETRVPLDFLFDYLYACISEAAV